MNCNEMHANLYWGHRAKKNTNRTIYHKHIPAQLTSHVGSISKSRWTRKFIRFIYSYELFNFKLFVISHLCSCGKNCIYEPFKTVLYTSIIKHPILWYVIYCDYVSKRVIKKNNNKPATHRFVFSYQNSHFSNQF